MAENGHDITSWQSGGPFIFTSVHMTMEGNVCTLVLTVGSYNRTVQLTKATARDLLDKLQRELLPKDRWGSR